MRNRRSRSSVLALATAGALVWAVAGCGDGSDSGSGSESASESGSEGTTTTVVSDTSRIIPVNGDIAEVVFALGLGDSVVATDVSATYPPEADALPEVGYQRTLLAEPMLGLDPSVIVANPDAGPPEVLDQMRDAGVPVVVVDYPHDLSGPAAKIRLVARALGVPDRGEALAREVTSTIDSARDEAAQRIEAAGGERLKVAFLYLRGQNVQQVGGRGSGADALIDAAGAVDVGTEMGIDEFGPLTDEALIEAAPDVLLVTTTGLESVGGVDGLVEMPAVAGTPAGRDRRVVALDDQLLLGLGPRAGEALAQLVDELHPDPSDTGD
jgi:heme transport system substrate-binding protein